jgi:hypothetical protein
MRLDGGMGLIVAHNFTGGPAPAGKHGNADESGSDDSRRTVDTISKNVVELH